MGGEKTVPLPPPPGGTDPTVVAEGRSTHPAAEAIPGFTGAGSEGFAGRVN